MSLFGDLPPERTTNEERAAKRLKGEEEAAAAAAELARAVAAEEAAAAAAAAPERGVPASTSGGAAGGASAPESLGEGGADAALERITAHVGNPKKFKKCAALAVQLFDSGAVQRANNKAAARLLEAAVADPARVTDPLYSVEYKALFESAQRLADRGVFNAKQQPALQVWSLLALTGNALHTDDSYLFTRACNDIKAAVLALPEEYAEPELPPAELPEAGGPEEGEAGTTAEERAAAREMALRMLRAERRAAEEAAALELRRRDALLQCLETAYYKWSWAQTSVDILVFAAHDAAARFAPQQRPRLQKVYEAVRDAKNRRKGMGGGRELTSFEAGQEKYKDAAISIRKSVGGALGGVDGRGDASAYAAGGNY